jgi:hypothetical protein
MMFVASFDLPAQTGVSLKRKCEPVEQFSTVTLAPKRKISRKEQNVETQPRPDVPLSAGCTWSEEDWSCAYNSALMTIFYTFMFWSTQNRETWKNWTPLSNALSHEFDALLLSPTRIASRIEYNRIRDNLRDYLSAKDPVQFKRHGAVGAPVDLIFDFYLTLPANNSLSMVYSCAAPLACGPKVLNPVLTNLPLIFNNVRWREWCAGTTGNADAERAFTQTWIDLALASIERHLRSTSTDISCESPCESVRRHTVCLSSPPPLLVVEVTPETLPLVFPSMMLDVPGPHDTKRHLLRAIIYLGHFHFTARMIDSERNIWSYDGCRNGGIPWIDHGCKSTESAMDREALVTFDGRAAYLYIYAL